MTIMLLYYFIKENKMAESIIKVACKKSLGRTEKWFRREMKKTKFNKMSFYKICLFLGRKDYLNLIKESCLFIYNYSDKNSVRYKL